MGGKLAKSNPFTAAIEGEHELNLETAKQTVADAQYNAGQRRKAAERLTKEQVAAVGSSGILMEGSVVDVIKEDREEAELEAMNIIYSGKMKASDIKRRSHMQKQQGYLSLIKEGGMLAFSAGAFKGGGAAAGTTTMKNGGGFSANSTGSNGYTFSGGGSGLGNKGLA